MALPVKTKHLYAFYSIHKELHCKASGVCHHLCCGWEYFAHSWCFKIVCSLLMLHFL